jgi:hypothetical protein|tara:strand:+ start:491 stop:823 length:333 start_codon:yes stop_codon:yes gene_type:complete
MSIDSLYNSTGIVKQLARSQNALGVNKKTYTTRISALKCRLNAKTVNEEDEFGKVTVRNSWKLFCAATSTNRAISESDKITISSQDYKVTGIYNVANMNHHLEIELTEIR